VKTPTTLASGLAVALLLAGVQAPRAEGSPGEKELFQRNQPPITKMFEWKKELYVLSDRVYRVDAAKGHLEPTRIEASRGVQLALGPGDELLVLTFLPKGRRLLSYASPSSLAKDLRLPSAARASKAPPTLVANGKRVLLVGEEEFHTLQRGKWLSQALGKRPPPQGGMRRWTTPKHAVLRGEQAFLGYGHGEWGGGVLILNLASGSWTLEGKSPVGGMKVGPKGLLWVVEGLAHLSIRRGVLKTFDGKTWRTLSAVESGTDSPAGWNLAATDMLDVAWDSQGRTCLLTGSLGVVRQDKAGGPWKQLTKTQWTGFHYVRTLRLRTDDLAVIGTYDAGVLLWNLATDQATRAPRSATAGLSPQATAAIKKLQSGSTAEKGKVLEGFRKSHDTALVPAVIEAILDDTSYPRRGDTGWGRVYHHAASALAEFARKHDGKTQKERGLNAYSFSGDGGVGSEARRREIHKNWVTWWTKNKAEILK
jgi:hypothetical protein